jgi:hypothetical protein
MEKTLVDGHGKEADGGGFNAGLLLGYDFGLLALQGEILINTGWNGYGYYDNLGEEHLGFDITVLQIPVLVKLDLHWGRIMFQPQAGFYLNFGLGDMRYNYDYRRYYGSWGYTPDTSTDDYSTSLFGVMIGGAFGVRIGRGYLFLDIRYAADLSETKLKPVGIEMTRHAVMTSMGYQYYFRSRQ